MSHSADDCTGIRTNRTIKYGMGGSVGSRDDTVKQYNKSEICKKELKAFKKQNNMIYSIARKSGVRRDIKNINKIRSKASKRISISSRDDLYSNSLLAIDIS